MMYAVLIIVIRMRSAAALSAARTTSTVTASTGAFPMLILGVRQPVSERARSGRPRRGRAEWDGAPAERHDGVGPLPAAAPRVNDRRMVAGQPQRFTSAILPPYLRRSPRLAGVLPLLYLHRLSSGDFREALPALVGPEAAGLAPSTITRLTKNWTAEYEAFRRRDLATSTSGPTASTSRSAWRTSGCARSC